MDSDETKNASWIERGTWALIDQGLYALSIAGIHITLARWLQPAEYGGFAIFYSALLLIASIQSGLLIEPMLVFGSGRYSSSLRTYLRTVVRGNHGLAIAASLLLVIIGAVVWTFDSSTIARALLGLALALPCTLLFWLTKRTAYLRQRIRLAASQSAIFLVLVFVGLFLLRTLSLVSILSAAALMAFAAAVPALYLLIEIRRELPRGGKVDPSDVWKTHRSYGRWALLTSLLNWVPLNVYIIMLSMWVGLEASATLRALTNLALPALQANAALSAMLLPNLGACQDRVPDFRRILGRALLSFVTVAALYALVLAIFGNNLVEILYGDRFEITRYMLWLLALIPVIDAITVVLGSALRSLEQPQKIFQAQVFASITVLTIGFVAVAVWDVTGAMAAILVASVLVATMLAASLRKQTAASDLERTATNNWQSERQNHCDLCGNLGALFGRAQDYDLLSCPRCGLLWTDPLNQVSQHATTQATYVGEEVYLSNGASQRKRFRRQLKTFIRMLPERDLKTLRILEVGSGLGFFLDACDELGLRAEGCDIVEKAVRFANQKRERARLGTLDNSYANESFDAIFAFNLIEHLSHPKDFLSQAHRILKPDGILVLETPIQESLFHRLARFGYLLSQGRLNFFGMRPGGHIYKFSKRTFQNEIGFNAVYQRNIESPFGELWGNSVALTVNHKTLYRWSLPIAWIIARLTKQGNRLFLLLRKSLETQTLTFSEK